MIIRKSSLGKFLMGIGFVLVASFFLGMAYLQQGLLTRLFLSSAPEAIATRAADYMVTNQSETGVISYRMDMVGSSWEPYKGGVSIVRMIAGTGSLYNACNEFDNESYCQAADKALESQVVKLTGGPYPGKGFGSLGANALFIDTLHKRYTVKNSHDLNGSDLLAAANAVGENILWLKVNQPTTQYFYHSYDSVSGEVDPSVYVTYFDGETLMALVQLYELTGDQKWLDEAKNLNLFMQGLPGKEDHWHSYGMMYLSKYSKEQLDIDFAYDLADRFLSNQDLHLDSGASPISTATKLEALAALATAFDNWDVEQPTGIEGTMNAYVAFLYEHQFPINNDGWMVTSADVSMFGGIYCNCIENESEQTYVRIDAQQHAINGLIGYLNWKNNRK